LTGYMAGSLRGVELIRRWRAAGGNAVVFDIKDFDGMVNVPFNHPLAPARRPLISNLPKFARFLHSLGLHAIARIALFRDAYQAIHSHGVLVSLDVFGIMAWQRPVDLAHTGQDIAAMARHCDVLSPMIYPSHFFHMDGYANPGDAPRHFISESMERFREITGD